MQKVVGVKFQESGKIYSFDSGGLELEKMDQVIVESDEGLGFGTVKTGPSELAAEKAERELKKVVRKATEEDLMQVARNREKEAEASGICKQNIEDMGLLMKLVNVEYLFDGSKAIFYFTAEERVDFRKLVRELAARLHMRVEMRQIGVRDEAKMKCGIGPCGRLLCCSTWINNFEPVSVKMAKIQGLSLNPSSISGMCGRLMCCLSFEYKNYVDGVMPSSSCEGCKGQKEAHEYNRREGPADIPSTEEINEEGMWRKESVETSAQRNGNKKDSGKQRSGRKRKRWKNKRQ